LITTDLELCNQADYILSIAPQRDTQSIADRVIAAAASPEFEKRSNPLYFLDLNAVSPRTAREAYEHFATSAPNVRVIDGGIVGGPPKLKSDGSWYCPDFVVSGPVRLHEALPNGEHLAKILNVKHINDNIGSASGLKMCYAAIHKGFTALATQSLTAAHNLGVMSELQECLQDSPMLGPYLNQMVPVMPPKAYRWVQEMDEIAQTFEDDGMFSPEESIFRPIGRGYEFIANHTELGKEQTDDRKRGKTAEDVAALLSAGLEKRKLKAE
jgi:3-hydroxyisobutyrate dehydrogenase-like beta-hydroxyacid dehydrogenase